METKEAIKAVIEQDGLERAVEWIAGVVDEKHSRIEKLEAALRNVTTIWDVWQKEKDSNSFTELFASICEAKELKGKENEEA